MSAISNLNNVLYGVIKADSAIINVLNVEVISPIEGATFLTITGDVHALGTIISTFTGNMTGNVIGNVVGNVTGSVLGTINGNVFGNVTGNVTENITEWS